MHQRHLLRLSVASHEKLAAVPAEAKPVGHSGCEQQPLLLVQPQLDAAGHGSGVIYHAEHCEAAPEFEDVQPSGQVDSAQD